MPCAIARKPQLPSPCIGIIVTWGPNTLSLKKAFGRDRDWIIAISSLLVSSEASSSRPKGNGDSALAVEGTFDAEVAEIKEIADSDEATEDVAEGEQLSTGGRISRKSPACNCF